MFALVSYCATTSVPLTCLLLSQDTSLEGDQFQQIMGAIAATKSGIEQQFATNLNEPRQEVAATQATCSQQVLEKLNRKSYTFKKKGCEHQFVFNDKVNDRLQNTKK